MAEGYGPHVEVAATDQILAQAELKLIQPESIWYEGWSVHFDVAQKMGMAVEY